MAFKFVMMPPQSDVTREWAKRIREAFPAADLQVVEDLEEAEREIPDADAAFGTIPKEVLGRAERLRWLQAPAAAPPAGYYYPELIRHPVTVTNFRGIYNDHVGAHIMAFVLAFARGLHRYVPQQLRREWQPDDSDEAVVHLPDATALILGVGGIGGEAARLCSAFGIRVIGIDARRDDVPEGVKELHRPEALDDLLPQADFVIMTIPHTPETEGLMDAAKFRLMGRHAFLINVGRGATVKLDDLVNALREGEIAGAGLDVYEVEPLPAEHPLWTMPGVLMTPHVAAAGPHLDERRLQILLENCRRFSSGRPLKNVVDKERWF